MRDLQARPPRTQAEHDAVAVIVMEALGLQGLVGGLSMRTGGLAGVGNRVGAPAVARMRANADHLRDLENMARGPTAARWSRSFD